MLGSHASPAGVLFSSFRSQEYSVSVARYPNRSINQSGSPSKALRSRAISPLPHTEKMAQYASAFLKQSLQTTVNHARFQISLLLNHMHPAQELHSVLNIPL